MYPKRQNRPRLEIIFIEIIILTGSSNLLMHLKALTICILTAQFEAEILYFSYIPIKLFKSKLMFNRDVLKETMHGQTFC